MCEWHLEYYVCIWWMGMFHRSACIWMRSSRSRKGSFQFEVRTCHKGQSLQDELLVVCLPTTIFRSWQGQWVIVASPFNSWWRWWSGTLWLTLIRLWPHSSSCVTFEVLFWSFICNIVDMYVVIQTHFITWSLFLQSNATSNWVSPCLLQMHQQNARLFMKTTF